jgi:hypothetical protein
MGDEVNAQNQEHSNTDRNPMPSQRLRGKRAKKAQQPDSTVEERGF